MIVRLPPCLELESPMRLDYLTFGGLLLALQLFAPLAATAATTTPDLEQIMADPDWIGAPVEAAWWQLDGQSYVYRIKRTGSDLRDLVRVDLASGHFEPVEPDQRAGLDAEAPIFDRKARRALMVRDGQLLLRNLDDGTLRQLSGTFGDVSNPRFAAEPHIVQFQAGSDWYRFDLDTGVTHKLADLRMEDAPHSVGKDALAADQLRLFSTLERIRARQQQLHEQDLALAAADPTRGPVAWYLGKGDRIAASALSADGRWLLAVIEKEAGDSGGKRDRMPSYVTRSGYIEIEDVRSLVGRDPSTPQRLWLLDLRQREKHELDLDSLNGRAADPLAELKQAREIKPHDGENPRPVRITGVEWHPLEPQAVFQVRAIDNKDRWTVRLDAPSQAVREIHRLNDPAWINWAFNEFGWIPDSDQVWLLSEQSGYSHLYTIAADGRIRQRTEGAFEVFDVQFSRDGRDAWMLSNRAHSTEYDLYRFDPDAGEMLRLTNLKGLESYAVHPRSGDILLRHSGPYVPAQASVLRTSGERVAATDTLSAQYRAIEWQQPEFVGIPSSHVEPQIWTRFYSARGDFQGKRPVVVFVHGAGYTQNTHHRFPYYFREQMFHNLLTARGYHVIDMDYRASRGYGRDWRTAIYRQMGTPELEDLIDGVNWLVENHDADPQRVGVYGGSYGGFMSFMALFNAPEVFAAGAALRPVSDWTHYNHGYTSNILNTPQVDPEAYLRSSPIEFVDQLRGQLLISHGMLDDNVFYKDSVRLVQRLIELKKENWELASYPLEPHGYVHPESWLDQYRRILKLFESSIGD